MILQGFTSVLSVVFLLALCAEGSDIVFNQSTSSFLPPVTKNFTLQCSLKESAASAVIGRRGLTHTDNDIMYVTSMIVMHDGVDIASMSEHVPVQVLSKATNVKATGKITSGQSQRGYIQLDWNYPTDSDAGEYQCDVTGITKKGHSFVFSKTLELTKRDPTMADLSSEIAMLKKTNDDLQVEKATMQGQISTHTSQLSTHTSQISTMNSQITSLTNDKNSLKTRMTAVEKMASGTRSVLRTNCHWTPSWVNSWDGEFNYTPPSNSVLVGVHSVHNDYHEDRLFQFYYCSLTSPHP